MAGIKSITNRLLYTAAVACADSMTPEAYAEGRTFPKIEHIREGRESFLHLLFYYYFIILLFFLLFFLLEYFIICEYIP